MVNKLMFCCVCNKGFSAAKGAHRKSYIHLRQLIVYNKKQKENETSLNDPSYFIVVW